MAKKPNFQELERRVKELEKEAVERGRIEKALMESEDRYHGLYELMRLIADNVPDLIWAKDIEGAFIFVNQAMCDKLLMCGTPDEAVGKTDMCFAEQEKRAGYKHTFGEICADSDAITKERKAPGRFLEDGLVRNEYLVLDVHKAPFLNESGEMIGTVGCGRDVTKEKEIEKALQESEKKLKAQYKNIPVPTYAWQMIGEDLVLTNFNDAAEEITKGRISEFLGMKAREMYQDMPEILDDLTRCFSEKTIIEREISYRMKSTGEEKDLAVKYAFVPPDSVLVHTEDITQRVEAEKKLKESHNELEKRVKERTRELADTIGVLEAEVADRKHAEEELQRSEEKYRLLAETAGELILTCDLEGRVTYVNKAGLQMSGYGEEEALKTNLADVLPEDQVETFRERLARRMAGDTSCFLYETEFINKEGNRIAIEVSSSLLTEDGEPSGVLVAGRDISARKRAEEELRESEEKYRKLYAESKRAEEVYRSLLHTSADAIVIYDLEGNTRYINPSFTKIFGWRMEEVEGKRIPFLPESEKEKTMALIMDLIENGTPCHGYETKRFAKDGCLLYVGISASRYDDQEGKPAGMLVTLRDISERKRLEAQLRHAQRMEAFAHGDTGADIPDAHGCRFFIFPL
jgi:PAS domain S-box-containing protein